MRDCAVEFGVVWHHDGPVDTTPGVAFRYQYPRPPVVQGLRHPIIHAVDVDRQNPEVLTEAALFEKLRDIVLSYKRVVRSQIVSPEIRERLNCPDVGFRPVNDKAGPIV